MKKAYLYFLFISLLFASEGCRKSVESDLIQNHSLIEESKDYFDKNVISNASIPQTPSGTTEDQINLTPRKTLLKDAVWEKAYVTHLSAGDAVVVPLHYRKPFVIKSSFNKNKLYSIDDLAKLLIYRDANKNYHAEVITFFPDSNYTNLSRRSFSGIVFVEDWSGNPVKKYKYANGSIKKYDPVLAARQATASSRQIIQVCYEIYGYNYSIDNPNERHYWSESGGCDTYFVGGDQANSFEADAESYEMMGGGGGGGSSSSANGFNAANIVTVLPGSSTIANIKEYTKCFDTKTGSGHSYQVSVCVSQPEPGSRETWTFSDADGSSKGGNMFAVGHTFLILSETAPSKTTVRNVGFYPSGGVTPYSPSSPGSLNNDEMHDYNISLTVSLTSSQFTSLLNYIAQAGTAGYTYNLNSNNCTTFALNALGSAGINLPRTTGEWLNGSGNDPGDLGEDIRQMKLASNMTRSTSEVAHFNKGTCK